jgi:hypothetical protein
MGWDYKIIGSGLSLSAVKMRSKCLNHGWNDGDDKKSYVSNNLISNGIFIFQLTNPVFELALKISQQDELLSI